MIFFTSYSTCSSGLSPPAAYGSSIVGPSVVMGFLRSSWWRTCAATSGRDGNGEADAGERVVAVRVDESRDDPDHLTGCVHERPARAARVHRGVELDQAADG